MKTSTRRILANRKNAKSSTGPRSQTGKRRVAQNATRHGLSSAHLDEPGVSERVRLLAQMIVPDTNDEVYQQVLIIAEAQLLIGRVRAAQINAIESFRRRSSLRSPPPGVPANEEMESAIR